MEPSIASGTVVYAGEPGAFAEDAVLAAFGDVDRSAVGSFRAVFETLAAGPDKAAGVVPIETWSTDGSRELRPAARARPGDRRRGRRPGPAVPRRAARPGPRRDRAGLLAIQALGQAEAFLRTRPWQLLTTYNTAGAGKSIAERGERGAAAVLSPRASALFGLEVLADDIQDVADNRTRFLILAPAAPTSPCLSQAAHRGPRSPSRSATNRARSSRSSRCSRAMA